MSFGSSTFGGFGSNNNNANANAGGNLFGNTGGGFGSNTNTGGAFGAASTNSPFGASTPAGNAGGGGLFGQSPNSGGAFGGSNTGGFGSNNNTAAANPFGASRPNTFGSTSSQGGLFGGGNNQSNGSPFAGFGGSNTTNTNTTSAFGNNTAANTSGGLFGSGSTGGGFGSNTNTAANTGGSLFGGGNASNSTSAFGAGNNTAGGGFGSTNTGGTMFGGGAGASVTGQNNGTGSTPYQPHVETDSASGRQVYQSISCMPAYQNYSLEELRTADYQQGRIWGNQSNQAGAFGTSTGFGQQFGAANNAANTAQPATGGLFGNNAASTGGAFGANNNNPTTSGFGFGANNNNNNNAGGAFGAKPGGLFGAGSQTASTGSGLFGNNNTANTTSAFGAAGNTGSSLFGNNANQAKPNPFGASNTTGFGAAQPSSPFGAANNNTTNNTPQAGGLFGGAGASSGGLFGNSNNTNAAPSNNAFGGFGAANHQQQQQQQQQQTTGGGLFGGNSAFGANNNNNNAGKGLFGAAPAQGNSLFGGANNQQPAANTGTSLFGGGAAAQPASSGGLFGSKPATSNGLFGGTNTAQNAGNSLFGGGNNSFSNPANNNAFGAGAQNKSLFGGTTAAGSSQSLFGGMNNNQQQQAGGSSLFGQPQQQNAGNSMMGQSLGASILNPQGQASASQYLSASAITNPYGNESLFKDLATPQQNVGPLATPLSSSQKPRKPTPLASWKVNPSASTRLITPQKRAPGGSSYGFSYSTYGTPGSAYGSPAATGLLGSTSRALSKSLSTSNLRNTLGVGESLLSPDAFNSANRSYRGSGSLKRLSINRNLRSDLFSSGGPADALKASPLKKTVSFDAENQDTSSSSALVRTEQDDDSDANGGFLRSSINRKSKADASNGSGEPSHGKELAIVPENESTPQGKVSAHPVYTEQDDEVPGDYWMSPSKDKIQSLSREARANLENFIVGRQNVGQIRFFKVDLTAVPLDKIFGEIVILDRRSATVYPDGITKAKQGQGLNVPAQITLDNSFPRARGGQVPVYERKGPRFEKHIERLKRIPDTEFVDYIIDKGQWIFNVEHFSTYALDYEDFDDESEYNTRSMLSPLPGAFDDDASPSQMRQANGNRFEASRRNNNQHLDEVDDTFEFRASRVLPGAFDQFTEPLPSLPSTPVRSTRQEQIKGNELIAVDDAITPAPSSPYAMDVVQESGQPKYSPSTAAGIQPRSIMRTTATPARTRVNNADDWMNQLQQTLSPKKQDRQALRNVQGSLLQFKQNRTAADSVISKEANPFATSIDVMNSLFGDSGARAKKQAASAKNLQWPFAKRARLNETDMSEDDVAFHHTFKPTFTTGGKLIQSAVPPVSLGVSKEQDGVDFVAVSPSLTQLVDKTFEVMRSSATITKADGVPFASLSSSSFLVKMQDVIDGLSLQDKSSKEELLVWKLFSILFDGNNAAKTRKEALCTFWGDLVTERAQAQADQCHVPEEKAIALLSGNLVQKATEVLIQGRDFRLATMTAQIGSADTLIREALTEQLQRWRESDYISEIPLRIRAIYELLAGNTCVSQGKSTSGPENKAETFNISSLFNLSWRQAFGLRLWYAILPDQDEISAIEQYAKELGNFSERTRPVPWFTKEDAPIDIKEQDILWGLLRLHAAKTSRLPSVLLGEVLSPASVSGSATNARLSFQLYHALRALSVADFHGDAKERQLQSDELTTTLLFQLSGHASHLLNAVFVALHLREAGARATTVQDLLHRHAAALGSDAATCPLFQALVNDLRIPDAWIWRAKALHALAVRRDPYAHVRCLLRAGDAVAAHDALRRSVAPTAIIEEKLDLLKTLLAEVQPAVSASEWEQGAAVFGEYIAVLEMPAAKPERRAEAANLLRFLNKMGDENLKLEERVAFWEIRSVLAGIGGFEQGVGALDVRTLRDGKSYTLVEGLRQDEVLEGAVALAGSYYAARVAVA